MKYRFSLIALVSAVSLPALATSGITAVPGEAGFTTHACHRISNSWGVGDWIRVSHGVHSRETTEGGRL